MLHSHVVVEGNTSLGARCEIFPFAVVGTRPQDKKLKGVSPEEAEGRLVIGDDNEIREHVTLHGGTPFGGGQTTIGDRNMFLVGTHVGHDATIGSDVIFTNGAQAAGHVDIGDHVILGGMVGLHQFARIGSWAMVGGGAMVSSDVPPYCLVQGDRARLVGANVVGLRRGGFSSEKQMMIKKILRLIFWRDGLLEERLANARAFADGDADALKIIEFVESSERGIVSPRGRLSGSDELGTEQS